MRNKTWLVAAGISFATILAPGSEAFSREIHVAGNVAEPGTGTLDRPYRTINRAASVAQPGDVVTVHRGTYREWVKPPRGGTAEEHRITYRAAPGETAYIKGSERVTSWTGQPGGVWTAELPNSFFGRYNPYSLKVSGGWLNYGKWHHRGDVYLNGEALREKQTAAELNGAQHSWHCQVNGGVTTIRANFGDADPNVELTEINVRECLFMPDVGGLRYITVDGFHFMHAAANWAPPVLALQTGAVGPRMGKYWIIQNCTITNARCVGIILGHAPGVDYSDIDAYGEHIIRDNVIRRCGQAGIAGQKGATRSLISGNLIEETNYRREFGGWETAAIKFHNSVDTVICGNLIRGVFRRQQGAFGIWIDFGNQGVRITRNVIYDTEAATVFLEMDHGPTLVDNNVLIGAAVRSNSEATVFAHNLFVDCPYEYHADTKRRSQYYHPHTARTAGRKTGTPREDKWFNNIFVRRGLDQVSAAPGYESDYNVFLEGARKSSFCDAHSLVLPDAAAIAVENRQLGATVTLSAGQRLLGRNAPRVTARLVGSFSTVGQTIEDRHGNPITVDTDIRGKPFSPPIAGPLADLHRGTNAITWPLPDKATVHGSGSGSPFGG